VRGCGIGESNDAVNYDPIVWWVLPRTVANRRPPSALGLRTGGARLRAARLDADGSDVVDGQQTSLSLRPSRPTTRARVLYMEQQR